MEIAKTYNPREAEAKWYPHWLQNKFFKSTPDDRKPYTIVIPPPNVTGVLHMGHMLNNTIQDVLIRRARMLGYNACWVPGTDHASIATEAKVVALLKEKGINKKDLSREDFLKHAWDWKEKYGGIILEQLKKLGASCDWDRTKFTMDESLSDAVTDVFIDLFKKGYIYRGVRMVNWDPQGLTAVSDEEVIYKEKDSQLVYINYKIDGEDGFVTIATTRPETIMADTAVCVNPTDERYTHLKGKKVIIPLINKAVPIIFDEYVDANFGTGALKVTPAHDINDFNLGQKHKLPTIDGLTQDGKISEAAQIYVGMDRFACRKQIIKDLQEQGYVLKTETIKNKVGHSERTDAVIEPRLSMQWFLKMSEVSKPALEAVLNGDIKLIPEKFINTYKHWMENVHDWCISRQLWWGQRIPAWYAAADLNDGTGIQIFMAKTQEEANEKFKEYYKSKGYSDELIDKFFQKKDHVFQDEDVLDTWFSSWLWPLTVFDADIVKKGWDKANADLKYYYPTNDLVTAPEILFFWVARMIIAGKEYTGLKPFSNVYLTGIVRDKLGRKMSKSLGNSPDPLELIEKYGADGVRVGMLLCSPAGNDLMFDESYCEQGRNFANKVWNAFRLIKGFEVAVAASPSKSSEAAITWFQNKLSEQLEIINDHYSKYRMSDALMATYKLVWDDFCAWYLEAIKPEFVDGKALPIDKVTYDATINFLEQLLKIMHPWMPFITEEIWHLLEQRTEEDCIIVAKWPKIGAIDKKQLSTFEVAKELIAQVRNVRAQKQISPKEKLEVFEKSEATHSYFDDTVIKLANLSGYNYTKVKVEGAFAFQIKTTEFFIPLANNINVDEERARLQKELSYNKGFLESVMKKLSNEKFVANAKPEILEAENKKKTDAESKINTIEEQLRAL
ncbi:MAG: valine--tRNA ligase [Bacteroidetes bacterium]|nr:valine--tRNA ligase [Bacteroidota bacterium]MCA6442816.1 valine--tRNA ligase [Bacteroidota bacterium]